MEAPHARVHLLHELARARGSTIAFERELCSYRELVVEILSCDVQHHHVAREKLDVIARSVVPRYLAYMRERLDDVRQLHAESRTP